MIVLYVIFSITITFHQVELREAILSKDILTNGFEIEHSKNCPPWFYYDSTTKKCECFHHPNVKLGVICRDTKALINFGYCMTYNENDGITSLGQCASFLVHDRNVSERSYLRLPKNVSELNDYMCTPMNRKGLVCSECIDGFGPSVFSYGFQCTNCTNSWYGIPVYLLLEFVPITVFYLFILAFQISVTTAPMTSFVLYSQFASLFLQSLAKLRSTIDYEQGGTMYFLFKLITAYYGIWNLDLVRFLIPPFCISPHLKQLHIVSLIYVSAFYSIIMISITWACIELYSRNFKPLFWLFDKIKALSRTKRETRVTIIDVFATFFLLSYTKMMHTSLYILFATYIFNMNDAPTKAVLGVDPSVGYFSKEHIPFAIFAFIILLGPVLLPALLLAFYPIRYFRLVLEKCGLRGHMKVALDIFVEKFYSCYRDGLEGGKDLRSLASLYFFIRILTFLVSAVQTEIIFFFVVAVIFCSTSLLIAIVRPYKKPYMNNFDVLVLTTMSLVCFLYVLYLYLMPRYSKFMSISFFIVYTLPSIGYSVFAGSIVVKIAFNRYKESCKFCPFSQTENSIQNSAYFEEEGDLESDSSLPYWRIHSNAHNMEEIQYSY